MTGFAITGSFCTHEATLEQLEALAKRGIDLIPILSERAYSTDTRFGKASELREKVRQLTGKSSVHTICQAELFGPKRPLEALIIAPCTGNTLAKLAQGITDTSVCMATKAHFRQSKPVLIALASNDAMGANLSNIATLLNKKNVYFVPLRQDDTVNKPHSLVADFSLIPEAYDAMLRGVQLRPLFI